MSMDAVPDDQLDRETLRERLRVAEQRLALAEAQLALGQVAKAPAWLPTDRKAAEVADRLHDLAPALDVLFHTAEVAMVLLTEEGVILRANRRAAELWGLPVSEICGRRTLDMTAPEDQERTRSALSAPNHSDFLVKRYVRPDGTRVPALAMGWPLTDDDGNTVCLLGVAVPTSSVTMTASVLKESIRAHPRGPGSMTSGGDE